jgi:hypothetical protein
MPVRVPRAWRPIRWGPRPQLLDHPLLNLISDSVDPVCLVTRHHHRHAGPAALAAQPNPGDLYAAVAIQLVKWRRLSQPGHRPVCRSKVAQDRIQRCGQHVMYRNSVHPLLNRVP